ncbi:tetratricopeptide repeat protein [Anaeromyxobacter oryzisoli]|uniref:tetratricopeptide repeat protein n=1 Tax=Anaeromyxobacter oryzisoli TaxID=2925408 RepID=UPI001F563C06|nr:tetratricopeptide repeat protein [Anaeromyxobacter sp. SG63]
MPRLLRLPALAALLLAACGGEAGPRPSGEAVPVLATLSDASTAGSQKLLAGDPAGARGAYEAALTANPDDLGALNDLAVSYHLEGHAEAARRLLDDAVANGPPRVQQAALVNLGELYALEGYLTAAQAYLETARGIDPATPEPWYALAVLADARGDGAAARDALREALRLDDSGAARAGFAYLYAEERAHLEALVAEQVGDRALAAARWREVGQGRFGTLSQAAARHLASE